MNQGALRLASAILDQGLNNAEAGRQVGLSESFFGRLLSGKRKPGREAAIQLRNRFSVPLEDWDVDAPGARECLERLGFAELAKVVGNDDDERPEAD